jgi:hypothetical protein
MRVAVGDRRGRSIDLEDRLCIDAREDAIDASPDVDRIVHDLVETMMPDRSRAARHLVLRGR